MTYFGSEPYSSTVAANLDAALATSLGQIPDGVQKRRDSVRRTGSRADHRASGRRWTFAPIIFDQPLAPGVWRPTPPGLAPFFDPWLGQVDPLVLDSLSQFRPGPPPAIASDLYEKEFEEVRDYGVKTVRSGPPTRGDRALLVRHRGRPDAGRASIACDPPRAGHQ